MKFWVVGKVGMVRKKILENDQISRCFACQAKEFEFAVGNRESEKSFKKNHWQV